MLGSILGRDDKIILGNRLQDSESPGGLQNRRVRTSVVEFSIFLYLHYKDLCFWHALDLLLGYGLIDLII